MTDARPQISNAFWESPLGLVALSAFLIGVFFIYDHSLTYTLGESTNMGRDASKVVEEGSSARKAKLAVFGLVAAISLLSAGNCRVTIRSPLAWLCLAFVLWCAASAAWANDPPIVTRRVVAFFSVFIAGLAAARRLPVDTLSKICLVVTSVFVLIGVLAELRLGTFLPSVSGYRFSGTSHPNTQGQLCALMCLAAAWLALRERKRILLLLVAAIAMGFLTLTGSRTSLVSLSIALTALLFLTTRPHARVVLATGTVFVASLGILTLGPFLAPLLQEAILLNRADSDLTTLTGRVPLWENLLDYTAEQPWLGCGYGGFWTADHVVALSGHWDISSAHSAYFEMLLGVGFIGLTLYAMILIWGLACNLCRHQTEPTAGYGFAFAVILFCLSHGLLESAVTLPKLTAFFLWWAVCLGLRAGEETVHQIRESDVTPRAAAEYTAPLTCHRSTAFRWSPDDGRA